MQSTYFSLCAFQFPIIATELYIQISLPVDLYLHYLMSDQQLLVDMGRKLLNFGRLFTISMWLFHAWWLDAVLSFSVFLNLLLLLFPYLKEKLSLVTRALQMKSSILCKEPRFSPWCHKSLFAQTPSPFNLAFPFLKEYDVHKVYS